MCFMSRSSSVPPTPPPPKVELPPPPPVPAMADIKRQSEAAPATMAGPGESARRRMRSRLTIASTIGTPGMGM